jgi:hypothetical protein
VAHGHQQHAYVEEDVGQQAGPEPVADPNSNYFFKSNLLKMKLFV